MANSVDQALVNQFNANVMHLAQQKNSRLLPAVRKETQKAEASFWDRIGATSSSPRVARGADTVHVDVDHSRRMSVIQAYDWSALSDTFDKLRMIQSPTNEYAIAAAMAQARTIDDVIISAALGTAYAGKAGATAVALANANKIAAHDGSTTTGVKMNMLTLRGMKKYFDKNESAEDLYFVCTSEQIYGLLGEPTLTSSDYNNVKALVDGVVDSYMGFKFIRIERLPVTAASTTYTVTNGVVGAGTGTLAAGARRCFAFSKMGLLLALGENPNSKIEQLPTKNYAWQVFNTMAVGAVRMEEERVLEVDVLE